MPPEAPQTATKQTIGFGYSPSLFTSLEQHPLRTPTRISTRNETDKHNQPELNIVYPITRRNVMEEILKANDSTEQEKDSRMVTTYLFNGKSRYFVVVIYSVNVCNCFVIYISAVSASL